MKIAAFNVRKLGKKKVFNKTVLQHVTKIISRYSVVVLLEVLGNTDDAMEKLCDQLNSTVKNKTSHYSMTSSCPLGRGRYKEKFVCFYRNDEVELKDVYQYEDNQVGDEDAFAREPFVLRFSCPTTVVKDLVLIPVHTKPEDSLKELDELHDVVEAVRNNWGTDNIMILGDFNADGRYLSKKKKQKIRIRSAPYHWLISDDEDTTSSNNNENSYDRIVVYGDNMLKAIVPHSGKSFNFQQAFKLSDKETQSVSDHYPVEVEMKKGRKSSAATTRKRTTKAQTPKKEPQRKTAKAAGLMKKESSKTSNPAAKRRRQNK